MVVAWVLQNLYQTQNFSDLAVVNKTGGSIKSHLARLASENSWHELNEVLTPAAEPALKY
jgi:hypothetical protein